MTINVDEARKRALDRIEKSEQKFKAAFVMACVAEVAVLASLLFAMDLSNRTHLLLLVGFVGSYSIVVLAIVALGAHVSRIGQRILRAMDLANTPHT
jgi:hypothetical protein